MSDLNNTFDVERPPVQPMSFTQPYWDGTREKKLMVQYCPRTEQYQFFPRPASLYTGRRDLEWREVSGKGELYSYTIARRTRPPFAGHEPFAIAMVTLAEGVRIMGNLINVDEGQIRIGMAVKPCWAPLPDGYNLLMFEPDS